MQVEHPPVTLNYTIYHSDGKYFNGIISLNLDKCAKFAKRNKIEFHEFVARVINHEFLHHLFAEEHDWDTCHDLDNIAKRLKDFWLW